MKTGMLLEFVSKDNDKSKGKTCQYRLRTELNSIILTKKKCVNDFYCPVTKDIYKNMV
jgi:hypothetical protein